MSYTSYSLTVIHLFCYPLLNKPQGGRITDYIDTLKKGQRVSYWWSDEDGWLPGYVSKTLNKVVSASTIRWTVKVNFDNTDVHTLNFHPLEKRWKVFHSNKKPEAAKKEEDEPKKKSAAAATTKKPTTKKSNKAVGDKKKVTAKKAGEKDKKGSMKETDTIQTGNPMNRRNKKRVTDPREKIGKNLKE